MRTLGFIPLALGLAACGGTETEAPGAATQRGIDRSIADIRAAEAATRQQIVISRSVGELTDKAGARADPATGEADVVPGDGRAAQPSGG